MTASAVVPPRAPTLVRDIDEAVGLVPDRATVMVGGFGLVGAPSRLIDGLIEHTRVGALTVISNNLGEPGRGLGRLLLEGRVRKAVGSYFTSNPDAVAAYLGGRLEIDLMPQGTLAEAIRAGGAGIGGFYTHTGWGTALGEGRDERVIRGEPHIYQESLRADVALVRARVADELGNLVYAKTARNFNPDMATAADLVIAEVDEVVPVGALDPEAIVTPHLFVDALVLSGGNR
jgi:3-oxoacid CoA-transferase subunit A/3-oxoadipate CoA-transferase alpha subunit